MRKSRERRQLAHRRKVLLPQVVRLLGRCGHSADGLSVGETPHRPIPRQASMGFAFVQPILLFISRSHGFGLRVWGLPADTTSICSVRRCAGSALQAERHHAT